MATQKQLLALVKARRARKSNKRTTTRTKYRTRIVRSVRRISSRSRKSYHKQKKTIFGMISNFMPLLISGQLLSHNQVIQATTTEQKVKAMINGITGSVFDFNIFQDAPKAHFHPTIEGAFNQWTMLGGALIIGGAVAQKLGIKKAGQAKSLGQKILPMAIVSGALGFKNNNPSSGRSDPYAPARGSQSSTSIATFSSSSSSSRGDTF